MSLSRKFASRFVVLIVALGVVTALSELTNEMRPQWDMASYLNMAEKGIIGNHDLVAPFAFRPAAPLIIGGISHLTGWSVTDTFRVCVRAAAVLLILGCFAFARRMGATERNALWISTVVLLNINYIKWPLFAVSMVDIYAYPIFLLAFYFLWEERMWLTLAVAAPGLFFKEFLLVPFLTVTVIWTQSEWKQRFRNPGRLGIVAGILFTCFILPRALIHVTRSFQDIDPAHPETLIRLIAYPLTWQRWFNIVFACVAVWLPVLMLLSRERAAAVVTRLRPRLHVLSIFLAVLALLVMYGGTNIGVFVSYSLPVLILVMHYLLEEGKPRFLELVFVTLAVVVFNGDLAYIPLPEVDLNRYLTYYGGYYHTVTPWSIVRLGEALAFIAAASLLRHLLRVNESMRRMGYAAAGPVV